MLSEISHGRFNYGISVPLYLEYKTVMLATVEKRKTPLSKIQTEAILAALANFGAEVPIFFRLRPNLKDENDNMVFECAANFGAEAIVTHNVKDFRARDLLGYDISIMRPGEFLEMMRKRT